MKTIIKIMEILKSEKSKCENGRYCVPSFWVEQDFFKPAHLLEFEIAEFFEDDYKDKFPSSDWSSLRPLRAVRLLLFLSISKVCQVFSPTSVKGCQR